FLKVAGLSAMAGVAAPSAFNLLLKGEVQASSPAPAASHGSESKGGHGEEAAPTGVRLGLVIDVHKLAAHEGLAEKCVKECHLTHNVPDFGNKKDEIKWIWKEGYEHLFTTHSHYKRNEALHDLPFLAVCNHCDDPPCVRACPTKATYKAKDGGVIMDFHRCIGCRFCMAACPYGARSFNWRDPREKDAYGNMKYIKKVNPKFPTRMRGVVEKCNFCAERRGAGLAPKCVEVCGDTKALIFGDMNDSHSEISQVLKEKYTIQRNPALGTKPSVFYII
ncbi:sulfate reduction electron transfer complex DsrMKJOP subunit DsrO, partial [Thermodesulfobacteriota bacterium]